MTAAKVIEEIKQLPPDEQAEVVEFAVQLGWPKLINLKPWDSGALAHALQNKSVDEDYPTDAMIRAQAFPKD